MFSAKIINFIWKIKFGQNDRLKQYGFQDIPECTGFQTQVCDYGSTYCV